MGQKLFPFAKSLQNHDRSLKACFVVLVVHGAGGSELRAILATYQSNYLFLREMHIMSHNPCCFKTS